MDELVMVFYCMGGSTVMKEWVRQNVKVIVDGMIRSQKGRELQRYLRRTTDECLLWHQVLVSVDKVHLILHDNNKRFQAQQDVLLGRV
jgi:hypothetical protein